MTILKKLEKAFFYVGDKIAEDTELQETRRYFHRNKTTAFFVGATRLDEDGYMEGETHSVD